MKKLMLLVAAAAFCTLDLCLNLNVFGLLDWGLSDVFQDDFQTVTFPMYPIYATLGVAYYY